MIPIPIHPVSELSPHDQALFEAALAGQGLRPTRQRQHIYAVLLAQRDHPTADEVYVRAKLAMPSLSLATVYNCLDTFAECGLVNKLSYERESCRYCPKDEGEHAHFLDENSGRVYDIPLPGTILEDLKQLLPSEFEPSRIKLTFTGTRQKNSLKRTLA
jgi:Fur family peroxide stress response transcriptional regulator